MALGRISGPLLKANLLRDGVDLAFETDLLYLSVEDATQPLKVVGVGINTDNPEADLHVNGTIKTTFLDTDNLNIGDIEISGDTIRNTQPGGVINLKGPTGQDAVFYQTALTVDSINLNNNIISTNASNVDLEIRPSGTGSVEIFADTNVYGNITVTGDITAEGNINVGDADTDSITFNADVSSNIIPDQNLQYSLGSADKRWLNLYAKEFYIDNLEVDEVDLGGINLALRQGNIYYVAVNGSDSYSGTHQNDPFATVAKALSVATDGDTVYIYPGIYDEALPLEVPTGVTVKGVGIRSVKIVPDTASTHENVFLLNGETTVEDLTIADFFYNNINDTGYGFSFAPGYKVTTRSPYIRNVSILTKGSITTTDDPLGFDQGDAGRGAKLDGSLAALESKESSCLFHSVTMITPGVDALTMTNGVRVEWLNSFTYFANRGLYAYRGNDGLKSDGKTRVKITDTTGTWAVGNTITYYDVDGVTVLAQGVVESINGDYYVIDGYSAGWETPEDRAGKTASVFGDAQLDTAEKRFGTASLALDGDGDYISYANQPDFAFGTGNFTIEAWVYTSTSAVQQNILDFRTASNQAVPTVYMSAGIVRYFVSGSNVITGSAVPLNSWNHIAVSRQGSSTRLFLNGVQVGSTWTDNTNYIQAPLYIGARWDASFSVNGFIDEVRVTKGLARYTANFPAPTSPFTSDAATVLLLHFNGLDGSTAIVDDGITTQDLRSSAGGTASKVDFVNYTDFGAEIRSIASANVYGNYGAYGDGDGVIAYLIGQNFGYIGSGKSADNDPTEVIQANEVVELNRAKIYYSSVDHKGDFRIGDLFYVNQQTGEVVFSNSDIDIGTSLTFNDGLGNVTYIDATKIETGNFRISGNTIETLSGDVNVLSASDQINLENNVNIAGNLDVVGNVTVGGDINLGDQSTDTISFVAAVASDIIPKTDITYDLGTSSLRWRTLYTGTLEVGDIALSTNVITTNVSNADLVLRASGTGIVSVPSNDFEVTQNLTVVGTTDLQDTNITGTLTHIGDLTQTGDVTQTGNINLTGDITVSNDAQFKDVKIYDNVITTTIGNNDLVLGAAGTGRVVIPDSDVVITQDLTVNGTIFVNDLNVDTTVIADSFSTGNILIDDNFITTTNSNSDLELRAAGTGDVTALTSDVRFGQTLTVTGLTTLTNTNITGTVTHVGDLQQTGDVTQTGNYTLTGDLTVSQEAQFKDVKIYDNVITTTIGNNNLELAASGTGKVTVPLDDVLLSQDLSVVGITSTTTVNNSGTITSDVFTTGDISIDNNVITTSVLNSNLTLTANGTGIVSIPNNNVEITNNLTVNGATTLDDTNITGTVTHVGDLSQTGNTVQVGDYTLTGQMTVTNSVQFEDIKIDGNVITTTIGNNDLQLEAAGTGRVYIPSDPVRIDQTLTVVGTTTTSNISNSGTITSGTFTTGNIVITGNTVSTTVSNSNLQLQAAGTGFIELEQLQVQDNELRTASNTDIVVQPHGTGIVSVNSTQSIRLPRGTTLERPAIPATGMIRYNTGGWYEGYNGTNWIRLDGVWDVDQNTYVTAELTPGANDNTVRFVSNGVQIADLTSTRLSIVNADIDSININNNVISTVSSNTDLVFQTLGTGSIRLGNFAVNGNTITNVVNNAITSFNQSGDGYFRIAGTNGFRVPSGTSAQRPGQLEVGLTRFNTDDGRLEIYDGTSWIGAQGTGGSITVSEAEDVSIQIALMLG